MAWQVTPYVAISFAAAVLLTTLAIYTYRRKDMAGTNKTGALLLIASTVWITASALEIGSFSLRTKIIWDKVQYGGLLVVPTGWFLYILQSAGKANWLNRQTKMLVAFIPLAFLLLILTNEQHHLIWQSITLERSLPASELAKVAAPGFWLLTAHTYLMLCAGVILLLRMLALSRRILSWQVSALLAALAAPWIVNILEVIGIQFISQADTTALTLALTAPVVVKGMWHIRLGDLVPVAREAVVEGMSDAVIVIDAIHRIADLNPAAVHLIDQPATDVIGKRVEECWPDWSKLEKASQGEGEKGTQVELVVDGEMRTFDMRVSPMGDWLGRLVSRVVVLRDITERRQSEQAIRDSAARYRLLAEYSTDMIARHDSEGTCLYVSHTCKTLLGYEPNDMLGRKIFRLIHPDDLDEFKKGLARLISEPSVGILSFRVRREDGSYIWVETTGRAIFTSEKDGAGPKEIISVTRNITERKEAEEALAAERERLAVTVSSIGDGVIALDAEKRIVVANPVAENHLDILAGVGEGDTLTHLSDQPIEAFLLPPVQGKNIHELTLEGTPKRCFEVVAQQMEAGPQIGGWVLVIRDVTAERESQMRVQLQERLAAVGQLAAGIAHDFNNILGAIILYSEMLLQTPNLSKRNRERLATIYQQAERAATLTRQILDYSRRTVMDQAPMDLRPFLKDTQKLLARTLPERIRVGLDCGDETYVVNADPARIQQILMNLALNARDAMPNGGDLRFDLSRLRVEPSGPPPFRDMAPGAWLRLHVSDTGMGIEPDVLPHVFEPFYTTKGPGEGSGLGLAQVYGIVKQHDGYIDVKSQVGVGTTFIIYLPAIEVPEWSSVKALADTLEDGEGETILVVEDDMATQIAVREILETLNYKVLTASDGRSALEIIDQLDGSIDLVLSDLVMPEMGGVELYHQLKDRGMESKVILMTGYPLGTGTRELLDQKGVTWLHKPLRSDTIARLIREVLEGQN